jgi:hypothetical protein
MRITGYSLPVSAQPTHACKINTFGFAETVLRPTRFGFSHKLEKFSSRETA